MDEIIAHRRAEAARERQERWNKVNQTEVPFEELPVQSQIDHVVHLATNIMSDKSITPLSFSDLAAKKRKRPEAEPNELFVDSPVPEPSPSKSPKSKGLLSDSKNKPDSGGGSDTSNEAANHPFAPERKGPRKKAVYTHREVIETSKKTSDWYLITNMNHKFSRSDLQTISYVKDIISKCVEAVKNEGDTQRYFSELRARIHEMEFYEFLSGVLVKKSKVLEADGLIRIFDGPDKDLFPWDIVADAEALWLRWMGGDLEASLLRGVTAEKGVLQSGMKRTSYKLQKDYTQRRSANVVGANDLVNGQWWPSRICALRDGAHGEQEAGIHGQTGKGAYSVVVATGGYADKDNGETIEYCGTKSETSTPTKNTALLQHSYVKKQPLRVLRAVNRQSKYAPKEGIRYDGLYEITDQEILDLATAMFRFSLKRLEGQKPIRYKGVEARPTSNELKERMKIREMLA